MGGKIVHEIVISRDFSKTPGARYASEGKYSGQEFRDKLLFKSVCSAIKDKAILTINFDGSYGYPTSFLEEAFGGLVREYSLDPIELLNVFKFVSLDEPSLVDEVCSYIKEAKKTKGKK